MNRFAFPMLLVLSACGGVPFTELPASIDDAGYPSDDASAAIETATPGPDAEATSRDRYAVAPEASDGAPDAPADAGVRLYDDAHPDARADGSPLDAADAQPPGTGPDGCTLVTHSDGLGQSWSDCAPLGTLDLAEATAACVAGYGSNLACSSHICGSGQPSDPAFHAVCGSLVCWAYDGPYAGKVSLPSSGGCPSASGAPWQ
jgi:hypothetical protein